MRATPITERAKQLRSSLRVGLEIAWDSLNHFTFVADETIPMNVFREPDREVTTPRTVSQIGNGARYATLK